MDAIDYAKGIGILLVVVGHVWRGLTRAGIPLPQPMFERMDRWIYGFHMPLFFFVSGLFLYRSAGKPPRAYLIDKVAGILWPYLLWSLIYWQLTFGEHRPSAGGFARGLALAPIGHLWFLWLLFLMSVAMLGLRKARVPAWAVLVLSVAFYAVARWGAPITGPLFQFAMYFPYVAAAAVVAPWLLETFARLHIGIWIGCAIIGAAGVTYATRVPGTDHMFDFASGIPGVIMVLGLARVLEVERMSFVRFLGQRSLEIYLAHIAFSAAVRMALSRLGVEPWWAHLWFGTLAGIAGPLVLWWACQRLRVPLFRLPLR